MEKIRRRKKRPAHRKEKLKQSQVKPKPKKAAAKQSREKIRQVKAKPVPKKEPLRRHRGKTLSHRGKPKRNTAKSRRFQLSLWHNKKFALFIAIFVIALGLSCSTYVYAKYYSVSAREGIAVATGVYFSANYAASVPEDGEFMEYMAVTGYTGTDTSFVFEVRNYENNLLFNTANVDIPYEVSFWLGANVTDGSVYTVTSQLDGTSQIIKREERVYFSDQMVVGGSARADKYVIDINTAGVKHEAVPVYVEVRTRDGALINRILRGKMLISSEGMEEITIESQEFVVEGASDQMTDEEKAAILQELSAFYYEISIVGDVTSTGGATERLKLAWNPNVFEVDLFDKAYLAWQSETGQSEPLIDTEGTVDTNPTYGWKYITIDALPYSAESIGFFRGTKFESLVMDENLETGEKEINLEKLENYIEASIYIANS